MRQIKFRGKRKDYGYWLYGDYCSLPSSTILFISEKQSVDFERVITETVGQFTGLVDRNGKEIYEGDILLSQGQNKEFIQVVEFHNTDKTCGRGWVGVNHVQIELINGEEIKNKISDRFSYFSFPCSCEIIGNIHDNPELLNP